MSFCCLPNPLYFLTPLYYYFLFLGLPIRKSFGRCGTPLSEEECSTTAYQDPSYQYQYSGSWSYTPSGCYVYTHSSSSYYNKVYYNRGGTDCQSERQCLCRSGEYPLLLCLPTFFIKPLQ